MEYFVTGATGFIGTHLVDRLVGEGHEVTAFTRNRANAEHLADPSNYCESLRESPRPARLPRLAALTHSSASVAGVRRAGLALSVRQDVGCFPGCTSTVEPLSEQYRLRNPNR